MCSLKSSNAVQDKGFLETPILRNSKHLIKLAVQQLPINMQAINLSLFQFVTNTATTFYILVDDGSIIDVNFDHFVFPPPPGYQRLLPEKTLL